MKEKKELCEKELVEFEKALSEKLDEIRHLNISSIIVLAPIFTLYNITDGYFQRIATIDQTILKDFYKIYIHLQEDYTTEPMKEDFYIKTIDSKHVEIGLNPHVKSTRVFLENIFALCKNIYIHTVLRMIRKCVGDDIRQIISEYNTKVFWDVHGSVPDEFALYDDYWGAQEALEAEDYMAKRSDVIVTVTLAMKKHLCYKYGSIINRKIVVLPIFNEMLYNHNDLEKNKVLFDTEVPIAIYAGGIQKWQNIPAMQKIISCAGDRCRYYICVPQEQVFINMWKEQQLMSPSSIIIEERSPEALYELYKSCHYGFAIRDDIVVNRVACPTKIIEYIQFGILPVLQSHHIGDFYTLGMKYISVEDFASGKLPNAETRNAMARENFKLLKLMNQQNHIGSLELKKSLMKARKVEIFKQHKPFQKYAIAILIKNIRNEEELRRSLELFHELKQKYSTYIMTSSFDIKYIANKLPIECIYSYGGFKIGQTIYGNKRAEVIDFIRRKNIKFIIYGQNKLRTKTPKDIDNLCNYIGLP